MKKNIFKFLSIIFCIAFFLTGCATVSNVYNKDGSSIYFDDIQYFQGQVVQIGDYLYYGNGYTSSDSDDFDYNLSAQTGYLARINVSDYLSFDEDVSEELKSSTSPNGVEKVNDKLIGYQNQEMFVLGEYIYFTSANTHKTSTLENDYTQVSLFRVKFNGDGFEEFGTFRNDENSIRTVQKGSDGSYYYIIYSKTNEDDVYNLYSIKIGNQLGDIVTLAEDVESVAICDKNSTIRNIIYSTDSDRSGHTTDCVKSVDFATGEIKNLDSGVTDTTLTFVGRVADIVFYSYTNDYKATEVYYKDLVNSDNYFNPTKSNKFYNATSIKNIQAVGSGYMFISTTSSSLMYKTLGPEDATLLVKSENYSDVLFIDGDYIYFSNSTTISRINVIDFNKQDLVSMTSIISGQCGYTGEYIYFYAQLEEKDEDAKEDDTNYYMYRTDKEGNYQLIAKTK